MDHSKALRSLSIKEGEKKISRVFRGKKEGERKSATVFEERREKGPCKIISSYGGDTERGGEEFPQPNGGGKGAVFGTPSKAVAYRRESQKKGKKKKKKRRKKNNTTKNKKKKKVFVGGSVEKRKKERKTN